MAKKLFSFCVVVVLAFSFCATLSLFAQEKKDTDEIYTIKKGDTLWAISSRFLNNPFLWPKLWQRNPYITNPHWIYPGNPVRLTLPVELKAEEPKAQETKKEEPKKVVVAEVKPKETVPEPEPKKAELPPEPKKPETPSQAKPLVFPEIRDAGVFGDIDYRGYGSVVESKEGKNLMSKGDICYIWFRFKDPISIGAKYTTYSSNLAFTPVNIVGGRRFNITGIIQVIERFGDFYTAKILESFQEINKGDFLVPYNKERMEAGLETK